LLSLVASFEPMAANQADLQARPDLRNVR